MKIKKFNKFLFEYGAGHEGGSPAKDAIKIGDRIIAKLNIESEEVGDDEKDIPILKDMSESLYDDIDPYGEEDWEHDNLPPVLQIARKQNKPYDQIIELNCSIMGLDNLEGIENLVNLKKLDCSRNQLTSLEGIENLVNLKELWCSNNQLTSLDGIENLVNLKELWCSNNQLTSLDGIENLVNLKQLWCSINLLTSLKGIENLVNLKILYCSDNQLTSLDGIENLVNLKTLNCWNNRFSNEYKDYLRKYCEEKNIELDIWRRWCT